MKHDIDRLLDIMARLRAPEDGCPWDVEQTFETIAPYTIEEAYEVADAIDRHDMASLRDELGDLLLQVVFHARMAEENEHFAFGDVVEAICEKMVLRHPHVFGDMKVASADAQTENWETIKAAERKNSNTHEIDVAMGLPALMRAAKIGKRAAGMGFDWPEAQGVLDKMQEELDELKEAVQSPASARQERVAEEMGDFLFASANLARHLRVDPEEALRRANLKFQRRFKAMEAEVVKTGKSVETASLPELEDAWGAVKLKERDTQ
jgi:nucleoside triphosphate diphosphatase